MIRLRMADPNKHKCATCSRGRVTRFESGRLETICASGMSNRTISGTVTDCSAYDYSYRYAPGTMNDQAWILEVKKGRVIGFKPSRMQGGDDPGPGTNF